MLNTQCWVNFIFLLCLWPCLLCTGQPVNADYYKQQEQGWHWYNEEKPEITKKSRPEQAKLVTTNNTNRDPLILLQAVQKSVDRAKAQAVLNPTPENVQQYLSMQNKLADNANRFSDVWAQVLLYHPELNYALSHPTNQLARHVYLDEKTNKENAAIATLAKTTGLFFFYKGTCPYCRQFAPMLKDFSAHYGLTVLPISMDDLVLPEFPETKRDQGQAAQFGVTKTPALFTVDPYTGKSIPVAYGMVSLEELRSRILQIIEEGR